MKYLLLSAQVEAQINDIKRQIRLSMNGVVADSMQQSGIIYKLNFGVSYPRIKQLASAYAPSVTLAQGLWRLKIRETMLMAAMLMPPEAFDKEMAQEWAAEIHQPELVQQLCLQLFSKLSYAPDLCQQWASCEQIWLQVTAFTLAARVTSVMTPEVLQWLIQTAIQLSETENIHLYKAIALFLSRSCRLNSDIAQQIWKALEPLERKNSKGQQYITYEVKQELLFLEIL